MARHCTVKSNWMGVIHPFRFGFVCVLMSSADICELRSTKSDGLYQKGVFAFHLCSIKGWLTQFGAARG